MGDLRACSPEPNGAVLEDRPTSSSSSSLPSSSSSLLSVSTAEYWRRAEAATQGVIAQVQPTDVSERRRRAVIDYVQRLIRGFLGCEVFPFGSVPLKTYLPDGDIDLTAFGGLNIDEVLANDVCAVLEREDQNMAAEFMVKDVQLIRAEVKLVKCLVQNIVVDISFNQLGGLCTLCFLEQVDRLIGKDHLFKRSIILIKAWCYYESRILGAHHGLISTYGLETLVLFIFHLFHASLNGPLAVLYKFLDYFSKFDWDNYCISLNGPVRISSLPELLTEMPDNGGGDLLLSNEFLRSCVDRFSVPSRGYETNYRTFQPKHLNIVDPLKENNNLGRSVSKGNFYRIRSAFTYGARKLGRILSQPEENIDDEFRKFFSNTLDRHGSGQRPDVQDPIPFSGFDGFGSALGPELQEDNTVYESESAYSTGMVGNSGSNHDGSWDGGVTNTKRPDQVMNGPPKSDTEVVSPAMFPETEDSSNRIAVSECRLVGDAKDLATSRFHDLKISNDAQEPSPSRGEMSLSSLDKKQLAPHLCFSHSSVGNGNISNGDEDHEQPESFGSAENGVGSLNENQSACNLELMAPVGQKHQLSHLHSIVGSSEDFYPSYSGYRMPISITGNPETSNPLSDLSGDYDSHLNSLRYGRSCYEYELIAVHNPMPPSMPSQYQRSKSWDVSRQSVQLRQNAFLPMSPNGVVPRQAFYHMNQPMLPNGAGFGMEEMQKPRGTGTYFPNTNHYRDRPMTTRGRNQAPVRSPRNNGYAMIPSPENNFPDRNSHDLSQAQMPLQKGGGKFGFPDSPTSSPRTKAYPNANGSIHPYDRVTEFGPVEHVPLEAPPSGRQTNSGSSSSQNSSVGQASTNSELSTDQDRISVKSYHLKDEEDFPPLSA
ncbi:PREDICTED: uncharacterized protein LOC101304393 [Fragaria vesca subsp. vesca]|uniref:uncharacterized protein LOC101304393 n=1 Tax=Fragaria vesca subsp. vesca TaxID=101020 RepID=UPI0002C31D03|nr:PREDICTED: uncharacterized protein LOC101304393 [Fragaria vesca subsp. vesca]